MRTTIVTVSSALALVVGVGSANAAPLTASDILSGFNAVILGDFSTTSDVEGRAVIGGNMTGGATFNVKPGSGATSSYSALTVYGNETLSQSFNINNGGSVSIGGYNNGSFNLNGGGGITIGSNNSGALKTSGSTGTITIGGANTGNLNVNGSSNIFVGGSNAANFAVSGTGAVAVLGGNSGTVSLGGGSFYAGRNSGNVSLNASGSSVALNGSNTGQLTLNGGGTVKIAGDTGNINLNGGSAAYSGSRTGNLNLNGGATAKYSPNPGVTAPVAPASTLPTFSSTFEAPLKALSAQLDTLTPNSSVKVSGNSVAFNARPDASGLAVFDIDTSIFAQNSTVSLNLNGATSIIINVNVDGCSGTSCGFSFPGGVNFTNPTSYADKVLWNFVNATGLTFGSEFGGSVLALNASVSNNAPIDGTLVAKSFTGNGELHSYSFKGSLPGSVVNAPEPGSLALITTAVVGLVCSRRKRTGTAQSNGTPASSRLVRMV